MASIPTTPPSTTGSPLGAYTQTFSPPEPEPESEPSVTFTRDSWLQQRLDYIASIAPPPSPSSSSGGVS